jgi:hypothetical protein
LATPTHHQPGPVIISGWKTCEQTGGANDDGRWQTLNSGAGRNGGGG